LIFIFQHRLPPVLFYFQCVGVFFEVFLIERSVTCFSFATQSDDFLPTRNKPYSTKRNKYQRKRKAMYWGGNNRSWTQTARSWIV